MRNKITFIIIYIWLGLGGNFCLGADSAQGEEFSFLYQEAATEPRSGEENFLYRFDSSKAILKNNDDVLAALKYAHFMNKMVLSTLDHFKNGHLQKFDALVGDTACQIRAFQILDLYKELKTQHSPLRHQVDEALSKGQELEGQIRKAISNMEERRNKSKRIKSDLQDFPLSWTQLLKGENPTGIKLNFDFIEKFPKLKYLAKLHILQLIRDQKTNKTNLQLLDEALKKLLHLREWGKAPSESEEESSCAYVDGKPKQKDPEGMLTDAQMAKALSNLQLSRNTLSNLVRKLKQEVAHSSSDYLKSLEDYFKSKGDPLPVTLGDQILQCTSQKLCCAPFYYGLKLLMKKALLDRTPIRLKIFHEGKLDKMAGHIDYLPSDKNDPPIYKPVDDLRTRETPVLVIEGKTVLPHTSDYHESIGKLNLVKDIVEKNAAAHPQYPDEQPYYDAEVQEKAKKAHIEGFTKDNPANFCITHIYAETINQSSQAH